MGGCRPLQAPRDLGPGDPTAPLLLGAGRRPRLPVGAACSPRLFGSPRGLDKDAKNISVVPLALRPGGELGRSFHVPTAEDAVSPLSPSKSEMFLPPTGGVDPRSVNTIVHHVLTHHKGAGTDTSRHSRLN